jgi:hypothetical protein
MLWPSLAGCSVLGIGYTAPYLRAWDGSAYRRIALTPAQIGAIRWPPDAPNLSCTAEEDALPFPDLVFDRILIVHGLEVAENARRLLPSSCESGSGDAMGSLPHAPTRVSSARQSPPTW